MASSLFIHLEKQLTDRCPPAPPHHPTWVGFAVTTGRMKRQSRGWPPRVEALLICRKLWTLAIWASEVTQTQPTIVNSLGPALPKGPPIPSHLPALQGCTLCNQIRPSFSPLSKPHTTTSAQVYSLVLGPSCTSHHLAFALVILYPPKVLTSFHCRKCS